MRKPIPSVERLLELLRYDAELGEVFWKVRKGPKVAGAIAGGVTPTGYRTVMIDGKNYAVHRIIWKLETGECPPVVIDHKDGDGMNNRLSNLRGATDSQNACNARRRSDNTSGEKGVSFDQRGGHWRATLMLNQKQIDVGRFPSKEDATSAVKMAREKIHGEFARAA